MVRAVCGRVLDHSAIRAHPADDEIDQYLNVNASNELNLFIKVIYKEECGYLQN